MTDFEFDMSTVKTIPTPTLLPDGMNYLATINYTQLKERNGDVYGLNVYFTVLEPAELKDKSTVCFFHTAQDWGRSQFKGLLLALGYDKTQKLTGIQELVGRYVKMDVKLKPRKKDGELENAFAFYPISEAELKRVKLPIDELADLVDFSMNDTPF